MNNNDSVYLRRFFSTYSQEEKEKIRGQAFYPSDYLSALLPSDAAAVWVVRSPYAGAKLGKINTKKASEVAGLIKIITAKDIPHNLPFGKRAKISQFILAEEKVRFKGEPVALIVAQTLDAARQAGAMLEIDWKPEPLADREELKTFKVESGTKVKKDVEWIENKFKFPSLHSRYLENESGFVEFKNNHYHFHIGSLLSESQRLWISEVLDISLDTITAKESALGGQFGGRQQRELLVFLALAAQLTKRSVYLGFDWREQDLGSYGYHGNLKAAYDKQNGRLLAIEGEIEMDAGSYEGGAVRVLETTIEHLKGIYQIPRIAIEGKVVLTPTHPRRALKGEGLSAITWVVEQLMDKVAIACDLDRHEFRLAHVGDQANARAVMEEIEKLERPFRLISKRRPRAVWDAEPILGRGVGFQVFQTATAREFDFSDVSIHLSAGGTFVIRTSNLTLDLHVKNILSEVAASVLSTHPKAIVVEGEMRSKFDKPRRRETYPEFYHLAEATFHAANLLKKKMLEVGKELLQADDIILKDGAIQSLSKNVKRGYREVAFTESRKDLNSNYRMEDVQKPIGAAAGAVSRVSFNPLTGEVRVESVKVVLDAGPVFNRTSLEIEVESAVAWAMATLFSSNLDRQQPIPTPMDGPEEVSLLTLGDAVKDYPTKTPETFGAQGIADVLMSTVLASLVSAIQDAKGQSLEEIPMSLEFMYPKKNAGAANLIQFKR